LGGGDGAKFFREAKGQHGVRLEAEKGGVRVIVNRAFGPLSEVSCIPNVVPMAVSEKKGVGPELFLFEKIQKPLGCIYGEKMSVEIEQVGVGGGQAAGEDQRVRHIILHIRPKLRSG